MAIITYEIPDDKVLIMHRQALELGGREIETPKIETDNDDEEVTHDVYFGENIRRVLKALNLK